jgi:hypothetical protein
MERERKAAELAEGGQSKPLSPVTLDKDKESRQYGSVAGDTGTAD